MRLLRAALVALFVVGSEVLAAPAAVGVADWDRDRIDPLKSEVSVDDAGDAELGI